MHKKKNRNTKVIMFLVMTLVLGMSYIVIAKEKYSSAQGIVISADESSRKITILPTGKPNRPENYIVLTATPNAVIRFEQGQQPAPFAALRPGVVVKVTYAKVSTQSTPAQSMVNYIAIQGSKKGKTFTTKPPEAMPTQPAETQAPQITTTQPAETEAPEVTTTQPVETEAPEVTTTQPAETEVPQITTTQPAETEAPQVTTTQPAETEVPEVTTTQPVETEAPEVTTAQPVETEAPEVTEAQPEETKAPEVTTAQPEETKAPEVTEAQPLKKKSSPQIIKEYTLKEVCIIKVCKKKKAIIVAPVDAASDQSKYTIVHVKDDTKIIKVKGNKICKFRHLRRGQKLNILTDGVIIPSTPRETTAVGIMILK